MQLSSVISALEYEAITAMAHARSTSDYVDVVVHAERARRWKAMAAAVRKTLDRSAYYEAAPVVAKPRKAAPKPKAPPKPAKVSPEEFWGMHALAVEAVRSQFGDNWKTAAPFGETELVAVKKRLRPTRTVGAFEINYPRDLRFPAAKYWPGKQFPEGVAPEADYARADAAEAAKIWREGRTGKAAVATPHDAAWHHAHGYAWDGKEWTAEILLRQNAAHQEAIADYRAQKAAPFADIDDDVLKMAAD